VNSASRSHRARGARARGRRPRAPLENRDDLIAEVAAGVDDVCHHLVAAPLVLRGALLEARRRHGERGGTQLGHRGADLVDHFGWRELRALGLQVAADAQLLVVHGLYLTIGRTCGSSSCWWRC
jgi:hypothetical protein